MKKGLLTLALFVFLAVTVSITMAQEAPPERWYGDKGTIEFGLNGSVTLPTAFKFEFADAPIKDEAAEIGIAEILHG